MLPVPEELLHKDLAVADVVYNPRETLLIKKAKEAGCKAAVGGIGMLLWQGAAAFELFTGKNAGTGSDGNFSFLEKVS